MATDGRAILMVTSLMLACVAETVWIRVALLVVFAIIWALGALRGRANTFRMDLVTTGRINESLVLQGRMAGKEQLFMLDTGYAGPPVLSASYLATGGRPWPLASVQQAFARAIQNMARVTTDDQHAAIDQFLRRGRCQAYTSGCTMRLMGIGATQEQQADMLLCEMLELKTRGGRYAAPERPTRALADVFVTNPLPSSVHILTCDFLMHAAPVLVAIGRQELCLNLTSEAYLAARARSCMLEAHFSGGAYVVPFTIGSETFRCTVDTGAPGPISLGAQAGARLRACAASATPHAVHQTGVNGERICSQIVEATVQFCNVEYERVPLFVNDSDVDQVDGYVGMGFLRAFDILITPTAIGFAPNGNAMREAKEFYKSSSATTCENVKHACATRNA